MSNTHKYGKPLTDKGEDNNDQCVEKSTIILAQFNPLVGDIEGNTQKIQRMGKTLKKSGRRRSLRLFFLN